MARRNCHIAAIVAMACALGWSQPGAFSAAPCVSAPGALVGEQRGQVVIAQDGAVQALLLDPATVRRAVRAREWFAHRGFPRWSVRQASDEDGRSFLVTDRETGTDIFDVTYAYRIELAHAASSLSGRFTVVVQSNNVASEVTVLDAATGQSRLSLIGHDAPLAAYAIGIAFSPDEACVAISMERVNGPGAETWLLDLATGEVSALAIPDLFVLDWARAT
jgi:hypothetical protein